MAKVIDVDFIKKAIVKNADEVAEAGAKAGKKTFKNISKSIDDDIAKALSKKSAKESAELFMDAGESKLESMVRMASDDYASTKSVLRNYKKNGGTFIASATSDTSSGAAKKSAEAFKAATRSGNDAGKIIGDKNPLYVKNGGTIDKTYQEVSKIIDDRDKAAFLSTERGLMESIEKAYDSADAGAEASTRRIKKENLEELKHKIRNKEGLNSGNATGSGNKAQRRANEINAEKVKREAELKERLDKTKDERLKYIQDELRNAGMGLNGVRPDAKEYSTKTLKGKMYDSGDDYMKYMAAKEHDEALKIFDLKDKNIKEFEEKAKNNPILNKMKGNRDGYGHITRKGLEANRLNAIQSASGDQMGLIDHMGYNKIPQKATAGLGTFWLVNKLAERNGQQTNAQLYGQQPY